MSGVEQTERAPSGSRRRHSRSRRRSRAASRSSESDVDAPQAPRRRGGRQNIGGLPGIEEVGDVANQVANVPKGIVGDAGNGKPPKESGGGGDGGKDTLKLRLDLNLDVAVELKAKVHGDLTLSLL